MIGLAADCGALRFVEDDAHTARPIASELLDDQGVAAEGEQLLDLCRILR
jgi:hypothetical protein